MADTPAIRAACSPGEVRIGVISAGRLVDYAIWHPGRPDGVGDLHRACITHHAPGLAGSFVRIDGAEDGFLPDSDCPEIPADGVMLAVRVTRAAQAGKGPRLTARLAADDAALAASGPVRLVRRGPVSLLELAARHPGAPVAIDDPGLVPLLRAALGERCSVVAQAFDPAIEDAVAALAQPQAALAGGGRLHIQPTRALTAIDVDAGQVTGAKAAGHRRFNRAILPELARQIRLRNLSGAILVDLAGLPPRQRAALAPALRDALADDPVACRLVGFTGLGLAEIVRTRIHPPLHEVLASPQARLAAAWRAAIAAGGGLRLRVAPDLLAVWDADEVMHGQVATSLACRITPQCDPALPAGQWRLA